MITHVLMATIFVAARPQTSGFQCDDVTANPTIWRGKRRWIKANVYDSRRLNPTRPNCHRVWHAVVANSRATGCLVKLFDLRMRTHSHPRSGSTRPAGHWTLVTH